MKRNAYKFLTLGGIIGPILFTIITLLGGYLRTDYDPLNNFVSELGATNSSTELLMNYIGFIPSGALFSLFGLSLLIIVSKNLSSRIGSLLIVLFGLGMTLAGIFSCDPGCPSIGTMESIIHDRVSAVTFISAILGIILLGFSFKKMAIFRNISVYTILTGFISLILLIFMINSFESRNLTGLWQRLLLLSIFLWTIMIGLRMFKYFDELKANSD
ncbi:MAG: DUF998 domain-containing protein [Eudoraea sp.]|uniref:DUF998 domain-containing protein n=1 Tax=Eudoraea sp. TaxID=1979955 RepID=UPI003C706FE6